MKLKYNILLIVFLLSFSTSFAQYAEDALRFSQTEAGTTARFRGLGNAQTALGGDLSSLSGNPAGLGMFTKSDISLTADFTNSNVEGAYLGQTTSAQLDKLGLTQIGGVWHSPTRRRAGSDLTTGWLSTNFGVSYNKTNNFNSTIDYQGTNPRSSFTDYLADISTINYLQYGAPSNTNAVFDAGSLEDMAYNNFLIEYDPTGYLATAELGNNQKNIVLNTGSQSEVNFGFAANHSNKFYIGASIALTSLNYESDRRLSETGTIRNLGVNGQEPTFIGAAYNLSYRSFQNTSGSGLNAKVGMIYRPVENFRIGVNFISPTWYSITDEYSEVLDTRYTPAGSPVVYNNDPAYYDFNYTLRTPYRLNGGLAVTFANQGLITGDVEYVDYASIRMTADDDRTVERITNEDVRDNYVSAVNFRVGAEYKLNPFLTIRGGYNTKGNPYKDFDYSTSIASGGLGYRVNNFYIDATYSNSTIKYSSRPYIISESYPDFNITGPGDAADIKNTRSSVFITVGTRF